MLLPGHVEVRQSHTISSHFTANISTRCTAMFVVSCESTVQSTSFARIGDWSWNENCLQIMIFGSALFFNLNDASVINCQIMMNKSINQSIKIGQEFITK